MAYLPSEICGEMAWFHPFSVFPILRSMFKIILNAMWSKDYLPPLARVLSESVPCDLEDAYLMIRELGEGKRQSVVAPTASKAEALACDLLQFGCYTEVEQVAPLTDEILVQDFEDWFREDQGDFSVLYDDKGHVSKIIEEHSYACLRLETQVVSDWVGEEMVRLGARRLVSTDGPALKERLERAIAENEVRRMEIRAQRAAEKRRRQEYGASTADLDSEEE